MDDTIRYDSAAGGTLTGNEKHSLQTYLSDALALERHMKKPVAGQSHDDDALSFPVVATLFGRIEAVITEHIAALESRLDALGGENAASTVKSAWAAALGAGAQALNAARKTKISKGLRDDYTALSLAAISYTMLQTTALGIGDRTTATLAKRHLDDLTPLIVSIREAMPDVVLAELAADGENVDPNVGAQAREAASSSWRQTPAVN